MKDFWASVEAFIGQREHPAFQLFKTRNIVFFPLIISTFVIRYQRETKGRLGKVVFVPIVVGVYIEKTLAKTVKYTQSKPAPKSLMPFHPPAYACTELDYDNISVFLRRLAFAWVSSFPQGLHFLCLFYTLLLTLLT
jgi:hypothetical protein